MRAAGLERPVLIHFLKGAAAGVLTGVPIGPVNVAVIDAAYRHTLRRAIAVGLGGALGDGLFALVGFVLMGPFLVSYPSVRPALYAFTGVVLLIYGILTARSQPSPVVSEVQTKAVSPSRHFWSGLWLGFALIVLNPAAVLTWVMIADEFMQGISTQEGLAATYGVSCGSFLWFTFVAYLSNHGKKVYGRQAVWITRVVGTLLVGYALFCLGRAISYWFF